VRRVLTVFAVVMLLSCGFGGFYGLRTMRLMRSRLSTQQFAAAQVGQSESSLRAALPDSIDADFLTDADIYGKDPGKQGMPAGASCVYYWTEVPQLVPNVGTLYRLCFSGGALVDKKVITYRQ
jgi:hypothetical protein